MTAPLSAQLSVSTHRGPSWYLSLSLCLGSLLFLPDLSRADTDLVQSGEITINPSSTAPTLTLQGPTFDSATAGNFGLVLSYHDSTSSDPTASSILRIFRPTGQYQWQFSTATGDGRLGMSLGNNHALTLFDPANSSNTIVLQPGTDSSSGVYWNNQRLATLSEVAGSFVPLVNGGLTISAGGKVGIGTTTPAQQLTITGNFQLPATSNSGGTITGVIYQDDQNGVTPVFSTYTWGNAEAYGLYNTFLGRNAGNLTLTDNAGDNVGIGELALTSLTSGFYNTSVGARSGVSLTTGAFNVAVGEFAMHDAVSNQNEVAVGYFALSKAVTSGQNVAIGASALRELVTGGSNTAVGYNALPHASFINGWEGEVTAVGSGAGYNSTTGMRNTFIGTYAGLNNTTGSTNIIIGFNANLPDPTASYCLNIGNLIYGTNMDRANGPAGSADISSGNIGIGTATPAAKLDVNGDATVRGVLRVPPAGDIDMGDFTAGTNPTPPQP